MDFEKSDINIMKKIFLLINLWLASLCAIGQGMFEYNIIPTPQQCVRKGDKIYPLKSIKVAKEGRHLQYPKNKDEYYLSVKNGVATIEGNAVWARATLQQLTDDRNRVPDIDIHDWSAYPFRGFMHDVGRNFQTIEMLKETIDLMSFYKINYFHWHLTDYPAWRIECKVYPKLNDPQYQRSGRDVGKFYTYDEIRELIRYAKERGITVVPEIDMPGHSTYFTSTFGFTMDSEQGKSVLEKLIAEFCAEIPVSMCPYLHLGSDEINIPDPEGFMKFTEDLAQKFGRLPIAWDPGLPASSNTIRQIWNTNAFSNAEATKRGGKFLDSFMGYLNYYDPIYFTNKVFLHQACAQEVPDTENALGGILCLWNDVRVDDKEKIALHNGMINGMMVYAERFWHGGSGKQEQLVHFENKMLYHRDHFLKDKDIRWVSNARMNWTVMIDSNVIENVYGGGMDLDVLCAERNVAISDTTFAIARTKLYAENDTTITVWIAFETVARSNRIGVGIGQQGKWENNGHVWVNGNEYLPAKAWNEPGKYDYRFSSWGKPQEEEPYTDEQFYWMREPVKVTLHKGCNTVEMRIPKQFKRQRWSFAFVPVSVGSDGKVRECEVIKY